MFLKDGGKIERMECGYKGDYLEVSDKKAETVNNSFFFLSEAVLQ